MKRLVIPGKIVALRPICHGGDEKTGSTPKLRRLTFRVRGEDEEIPVISGNAIRGYLRRLAFRDFFERIGYEIDTSTPDGRKLYHAFFTGGVLEGVSETGVDVKVRRLLRKIPPASLFAMALGNQVLPGKLKVDFALPVCEELQHLTKIKTEVSHYQLVGTDFFTRRDDIKEQREEEEQAVQMMVEFEVLTAGTELVHKFVLEDTNSLEESCFAHILDLWKQYPYIGGRTSAGYGEISIEYDCPFKPDEYLQYLEQNKKELVKTVDMLVRL